MIVEIVGAYVDGLPIPNSSSFLTKVASVNLKGYFVKTVLQLLILYKHLLQQIGLVIILYHFLLHYLLTQCITLKNHQI